MESAASRWATRGSPVLEPTIIAGLLIVGLADNVTDSLSIHIYQESERLEQHAAFRATISNFATRLKNVRDSNKGVARSRAVYFHQWRFDFKRSDNCIDVLR
jgi:hypothetical protein